MHRATSNDFDCVKTDILRMRNYLVMTNILKAALKDAVEDIHITA